MTPIPNLDRLVRDKTGPFAVERTELQFLCEDVRRLELLVEKYKEATEGMIEVGGCGCKSLNGVLIEWCGDHY